MHGGGSVRHAEAGAKARKRRLPPKQAGDTAEALAEAMSGAELATKSDLAALRAELKAEIAAVRSELKAEIELLWRDLTIRLGGMIVVAAGVISAAIRYPPPTYP